MKKLLLLVSIVFFSGLLLPAASFANCTIDANPERLKEHVHRYYTKEIHRLLLLEKIRGQIVELKIEGPSTHRHLGQTGLWYYAHILIRTESGNNLKVAGYHSYGPGRSTSEDWLDYGHLFAISSGPTYTREGASAGCSRPVLTMGGSAPLILINADTGARVASLRPKKEEIPL